MISREDILQMLKSLQPVLQSELKIKHLAVYGSYARGDYNEDSDLDLLVDFEDKIGLFEFAGRKSRLQEMLPLSIDLSMVKAVEKNAMKMLHKRHILKEAVDVF